MGTFCAVALYHPVPDENGEEIAGTDLSTILTYYPVAAAARAPATV